MQPLKEHSPLRSSKTITSRKIVFPQISTDFPRGGRSCGVVLILISGYNTPSKHSNGKGNGDSARCMAHVFLMILVVPRCTSATYSSSQLQTRITLTAAGAPCNMSELREKGGRGRSGKGPRGRSCGILNGERPPR